MKFYRKAKATKFTSHGIVLVVFVPIKKNWPQSAVGWKIYGRFTRVLSFSCVTHQEAQKISLECGQKTLMGQIKFYRDQRTGICQRSCSVRPVGVRSDEGDMTAEAESILLDCSGPQNLFVFYVILQSGQINSIRLPWHSSCCFHSNKKTSPNRPLDGKFMAVLRECFRFQALHTRRPGKFYWNVDGKPQWARSCYVETRQHENARDHVPSALQVSEAMKEMRRQKRNPYHWTVQALETTLFFCVILQ